MSARGTLLRSYFVPNGSYLMELAEDGSNASQVTTLQAIGREIADELRADTVIVASPHWQPRSAFFVDCGTIHESFHDYVLRPAPFGRRFFTYALPGDPSLAKGLIQAGVSAGLAVGAKAYGLDHGAFCPLKVMGIQLPTVPISVSRRSFDECIRWGNIIRETVEQHGRRAVLIAPGNLCHRLDLRDEKATKEYFPDGGRFDEKVIELVTSGRSEEIAGIDRALWKAAAPEADCRPLFLIAGASRHAPGRLMQYQGAIFSVGDATFAFDTAAG